MNATSYLEARNQLENMFNAPSDYRHIIFWYDEAKNFEDDIKNELKSNTFNNAKIIIFNNNPFTIKTILEKDDLDSNYLIYFPCKKPLDVENWLLDTLLYGEEYYADVVALVMRKLNLESSEHRAVIKKYNTFFDSQERINQLQKRTNLTDNTSSIDFELGMMSALTKSDYAKIDSVLKEVMFDRDKYNQLVKFNFGELFWDLIGKEYSYSGEENIDNLIKTFLITSVSQNEQISIESPILKNLIIKDSCESACYFVNEILMKDKQYDKLQETVGKQLKILELISARGIETIDKTDTFKEFDRYIISSIIKALSEGSYDYDFYLRIIENNRITSKWYDEFKINYEFIKDVINFKKEIEKFDIDEDLTSEEYIKKYASSYYLIDKLYRHVINGYSKINEPSENERKLIDNIDNLYENCYLSKLGRVFSYSLSKLNGKYFFFSSDFSLATDFFRKYVNQKARKQFVIISDAFRYEVAKELVERLDKAFSFKGIAKLNYQIAPIPSITKFGMAALLPHENITYEGEKVLIDGKLSNSTDARAKILESKFQGYTAIQYDDIKNMGRDELRKYMADKSHVYIYHDVIDKAGEHNSNVFEACNIAINDICSLIKFLHNQLQISNYVITSDHGFVYRNKPIDSSIKYQSFSELKFNDMNDRYVIQDEHISLNDTNKFHMDYINNCNKNISVPYGYNLFPMRGTNSQYIHGGASLQEIITPVITISDMKGDNKVEPVIVRLKTPIRKIMNKSFSLQFEQCEKVEGKKTEANIRVYFVDENNNQVSEEKILIANKTSDNPNERLIDMRFLLKNQDFDKYKKYYLIMKDFYTNEIISDDIQFIIDIVPFKTF